MGGESKNKHDKFTDYLLTVTFVIMLVILIFFWDKLGP